MKSISSAPKRTFFGQKYVIISLAAILVVLLTSFASLMQTADKITEALKKGDAKNLAVYFNKSVELVILDKENIYSKEQAELVVKDFFKKYPPSGFEVQHNGGPDEAKYSIGTYKSGDKKFRVYYLLKTSEGKALIHLFRVEKE